MKILDAQALDTLFFNARTHNGWSTEPVSDQTLNSIYDLLKWAPTSANCSPARFVFVKSPQAKEKLMPAIAPGNVEKVKAAPVTTIIAYDMEFYEKLPKLFPHHDARSWFIDDPELIKNTAFRNGTLQGAYFILAARALGLDCGPMSGFQPDVVDQAFFQGTKWKSNFLCNIGYGDSSKLFPRSPRLNFDESCQIV